MGANAQTTVPKYSALTVLPAASMNISAGTGIPVFATTVTRDAAFGGANKVLAEGQTCYLESTNVVQYYDGAAWATVGPSSAGGLVPITPSSIAVGSGSASSAGSGQVTFTGVGTNLSLNGVFSSSYTNYLVLVTKLTATGTGGINLRLRASGTDNATTYDSPAFAVRQDGTTAATGNSGITYFVLNSNDYAYQYHAITLFSPNVNAFTGMVASGHENNGSTLFYYDVSSGQHQTTYQADGLSFTVTGGATVSGTVSVYGYAI